MSSPTNNSNDAPRKRRPLILYLMAIFLLIFLVYAIKNLPQETPTNASHGITGKGIILSSQGTINALNTRVDGVIRKIYVKRGEHVKKGQLLVVLHDRDFSLKLTKTKEQVDKITDEYNKLKKEVGTEEVAETKSLLTQLAKSEFNEEEVERKIQKLKDDLNLKNQLLERGLISPSAVNDVEDKISQARIEKETIKTQIAEIKFNLLKGYRVEDLHNKLRELNEEKQKLDSLKITEYHFNIHSPWDGEVIEILAHEGQVVEKGDDLIFIESNLEGSEPRKVYAFFDLDKGKAIQVGQKATVTVHSVNEITYGTLSGQVTDVSKYPISSKSIKKFLQNEDLVSYLTGNKATIYVEILLNVDPKTNKLQWSTGLEPESPLTTGTVANVTITTN